MDEKKAAERMLFFLNSNNFNSKIIKQVGKGSKKRANKVLNHIINQIQFDSSVIHPASIKIKGERTGNSSHPASL